MHAIDRPFSKIINGATQFVFPVVQRDYRWTETECEQLWNDILAIASNPGERGHFLGSIVYVATDDTAAAFTRWLLIDGQQRVTTLTLLLAALRDHILQTDWAGSDNAPTAKKVEAYFLKNVQEEGDRSHKLVLRRHDQSTLAAILDGNELPSKYSENIRDNYEFFREKFALLLACKGRHRWQDIFRPPVTAAPLQTWIWDDDRIKGLLASISRGFPVGAVMTLSAISELRKHTGNRGSAA